MNHDELFTSLHATTAADLDGLLDVEAGLREALVAAQHTRTGDDLNLDIEAGLRAITPAPDVAASPPTTHPEQPDRLGSHSAVAARLMSLDSASRLALRNHPAIRALALILELTNAAAINRALGLGLTLDFDHDLDQVRDLVDVLDHVRDLVDVLDLVRDLDRDLAFIPSLDSLRAFAHNRHIPHARARAIILELARELDHWRGLARTRARSNSRILGFTRFLGLRYSRARDIEQAIDIDLVRDLDLVRNLDQGRARARARARDLNLARNNFTDADLSDVDLTRVSLTGIRWSMATRWPSDEWRAQALLDSQDLGDGTYEIRGGTTNVATYST